ncbi:MAG TPA: DUF5615 family PIN-like protein [Longimicrobium sp.]|nr:DUF5615 family PIN-like protein [Longimicrobium sp.]
MKRVLFDENLPRPLKRELPDIDAQTVVEAGWSGTRNGALLHLAQSRFDVFLTADRNLPHQQNVAGLAIGIVVLAIGSIKFDDLQPIASRIVDAIRAVGPGEVLYVKPDPSGG